MKKTAVVSAAALFCGVTFGSAGAENLPAPPQRVWNAPTPEDGSKINLLLANYTKSVSDGDRVLFESQLLDVNIPFAAVGGKMTDSKPMALKSVQDYAGFRKAIFDSGQRFQQRFSNVKIEQLGNLAQVSLDYETTEQGTAYDGKGWKTMQLVKFNGQWKIASEFFTGYPRQ
jgi:hypothetical protein